MNRFIPSLLCGLCLLCTGLAVAAPAPARTLPDEFVVRAYYQDMAQISRLADYDVWEYNNLREHYVLVAVDRAQYADLLAAGWRLEIDERASAMIDRAQHRGVLDAYRNVDTLYAQLDGIGASYPDIVELVDYGDSYCKTLGGCVTLGGDAQPGYDLRAVRITNRAVPGPKPVFFLMADIHAREITTPELAMRWIDELTQGYGSDADITWMVDNEELWVVPVVNPDGRWIVDAGLQPNYGNARFFQRKNANRDNGCNTWPPFSSSQYGIDLNRNSSFLWNTGGSSGAPCSETYRGPGAASEVEVSALQALVASLIPDRRGDPLDEPAPLDTQGFLLSLHSYGNEVLRPWGTTTQAPPNETQLAAIGAKLATYNRYQSCQSSRCLYETSGTTDEWSYGELGVASFTFEIGNEFMPAYGVIDSQQWPDNAPAFLYIARIARTPYRLIAGPDARNLALTPLGGSRVLLRAVVDDRRNGNANVMRALYSVDSAYWQSGYAPRSLQPSDGAADSPVEGFRGLIDAGSLTPGRHTVYVRGIDAAGNAGPVSAIFLDVP
jgi:carboxypeptidase T